MGASSTSPPMQWADPSGLTSEDLQAFIATNTKLMSELKTKEHIDNYVLGKTANGTGCFHLETKDVQEIRYKRVCRRINHLESEIACDQCCCAGENVCKAKVAEREVRDSVRFKRRQVATSATILCTMQAREFGFGVRLCWKCMRWKCCLYWCWKLWRVCLWRYVSLASLQTP